MFVVVSSLTEDICFSFDYFQFDAHLLFSLFNGNYTLENPSFSLRKCFSNASVRPQDGISLISFYVIIRLDRKSKLNDNIKMINDKFERKLNVY